MIVDIATFIVTRGAQIAQFVNAVIAVCHRRHTGADRERAHQEHPVLIGALAAILGIGGIAEKVQKFFQALAKRVMKAVDWVVDKIAAVGKKIWAN